MTETRTHEAVVNAQFGARAASYLKSAVHAAGADLDALADLVRGHEGAKVLDLGCGAGHVSFAVAPHVREVVACDLSPEMLSVVAEAASERGFANIVTRESMAENLPFPDAGFDFVLSRYSTHHWRDLDAGLREIARVLKPGGIVAITDTVSPGAPRLDTFLQAIELLRDPSHVRNRSRAEWQDALARAALSARNTRAFRIRIEFATWIARMRTPRIQADAIRALEAAMEESVVSYFDIGPDGSFDLDTALFEAMRPAP
ncbi:MAG TPA: methyltransferase domain-containing protein [Acetobacteraceae bacterium]|nr:methyltransferase domain-containing protein [Acetobacteraceae bacterium]